MGTDAKPLPVDDPFAKQAALGAGPGGRGSGLRAALIGLLAFAALALTFFAARWTAPASPPSVTVKSTPALLTAIKDVARLETTQLHMEKVIDLSETQKRLFGLLEAKDAILLVAVGEVTIGVDLGKLEEGDVRLEEATGTARIRLPEPEIFGTRLDEKQTYVYERKTDALARRNEGLETRARQEAAAALEKAARTPEHFERAKRQAEKQMTSLATGLGAKKVEITWK